MKKSAALTRFSLSMPADLARQLDDMVRDKGYANRSQAVAELVRNRLVECHAEAGAQVIAGTITLVYDHHTHNIQGLLTEIQHDHAAVLIATLHVHLDHHNCMEVLAVRGPAHAVRSVADKLIAARGVRHGKLTVTTTGQDFHMH